MTREDARKVLYELINSGILDSSIEEKLTDIAECICNDKFEPCIGTEYCENCENLKQS